LVIPHGTADLISISGALFIFTKSRHVQFLSLYIEKCVNYCFYSRVCIFVWQSCSLSFLKTSKI
jgi:hypothetical protein